MPRSDPAVLLGWSWSRAACSFSARGRRVDRLPWRFCAQRRHPRRRQVCARRDALSSWREVRRPLPHRPGPSRSSTPDAFAPQARLDPSRGWRAGSAWAPARGSHCGLRGRLRLRALVGLQDSHADLLVICPSRFGQQVTLSARAPRPMSAGRTLPTPSAACAVPDLRGRLGGSNGRDARLLHARAAAARAASEGAGRPAPDEPPPRGLRVQRPQPLRRDCAAVACVGGDVWCHSTACACA